VKCYYFLFILQAIKCTEIDCKTEVCYLNYLDHCEENHGTYEDLGDGKVFKSPIDFDKIQLICSNVNCKVVPNFETFKKCVYCLKVFCCQGKTLSGGGYNCGYHYCYRASDGAGMGYKSATQTDIGVVANGKWFSKKFTSFNKTFFEVAIIRNNFIYKWIYVLALPDEAKNYYFHAYVKNANGENVLAYYDQVRSMVETHEKVIADGTCFSMAVKNAKRFVKEGTNQVDFSLKIRNLKDEAKDEEDESGIDD
jgi:hypothetical protein